MIENSGKLQLPGVSLVLVETQVHELAALAARDCLALADFGDVLIFTDDPKKLHVPGAQHFQVENWPSKVLCQVFCNADTAKPVKTDHILYMEWDAGIFDPAMWDKKFLEYDYIGAPWWYVGGLNVGNGGFSLRSKRLVDFLSENRDKYPITSSAADSLICREYRKSLEAAGGFRWADNETALDFAFECVRRSPNSRHFGYHDVRNWEAVLSKDAFNERLELAKASDYIYKAKILDRLDDVLPYYINGYDRFNRWELALA